MEKERQSGKDWKSPCVLFLFLRSSVYWCEVKCLPSVLMARDDLEIIVMEAGRMRGICLFNRDPV